ncbi:MAG: endonuclease domain-containing protein [Chloroflexi bacterium]|nr:endonuclease domain-containing protein [Chloroflexota bacterium]
MERRRRDEHDPRWRTAAPLWDKLKPVAREMRRTPTAAEAALWQHLRGSKLGVKFRRQHAIGRFIADFYCAEVGLVIEVDGPIHESSVEQDRARDEIFVEQGLHVLRFTNHQVLRRMEAVLHEIRRCVELFTP